MANGSPSRIVRATLTPNRREGATVKKLMTFLCLMMAGAVASAAQAPSVTLTATIGANNVPTLSWSAPWATSCTASGSWSGTKAASGSETLPRVADSATYNITCQGAADNQARLSWSAPTAYTDGTPLPPSQIGAYRIYQGASASSLARVSEVSGSTLSATAQALPTGTHFFAISTVTVAGMESALSGTGSKTITAPPVASDTEVVRNGNPPTGLQVE